MQEVYNPWEIEEGQKKYDVYAEEFNRSNNGFERQAVAKGLSRKISQIYMNSISTLLKPRREISKEEKPSFRSDQNDLRTQGIVINNDAMLLILGKKVDNINQDKILYRDEHPFGRHWKLATEIIILYKEVLSIRDEKARIITKFVNKHNNITISKLDGSEININKIKTPSIPDEVQQFYNQCEEFEINYSMWFNKPIGVTIENLSAREAITKYAQFESVCNQLCLQIKNPDGCKN